MQNPTHQQPDAEPPLAPYWLLPPELCTGLLAELAKAFAAFDAFMDTAPMPEPVATLTRLRWWLADARQAFAAWAYRMLSGTDLPDSDW